MKGNERRPDYGNWVSLKWLGVMWFLALIFSGGAVILFCIRFGSPPLFWSIRILCTLIAIGLLGMAIYFTRVYRLFSYNGPVRLSARILQYVIGHLDWDGQGEILDIGCGSGALSVTLAKKYPEAKIVGMDYWGISFDFGKAQCERNARMEGVAERILFEQGDAANMKYEAERFDAVISNFVFHEVRSEKNRLLLIGKALNVLKPGGVFVFHDLFYDARFYGTEDSIRNYLASLDLEAVHYHKTVEEIGIPRLLRKKGMLRDIGIIYGRK
ncbi:MAG: class I SAM-dependent methyltransferase [Eubacteriales bacterium]|nr:class I SAM-dependent methyltransferase [Eubacteriales bacterium]